MGDNVNIPFSLLKKTIELLEYWDLDNYDLSVRQDYDEVLIALLKKVLSVEIRAAYSKIVYAKSDDERDEARIEYLRQKRIMSELS